MSRSVLGRLWPFGLGALTSLSVLAGGAAQVAAQSAGCEGILLSTSEDFTMQEGEGPDGNPIVSDGDLLAFMPSTGVTSICRRNREILRVFQVGETDVGLDAVYAIDREAERLAFSTELDDPNGQFTSGDLLFTNGLIIPNRALTQRFDVNHDIGLDAVHLIGEQERWREFIEKLDGVSRDRILENPGIIIELLRDLEIDILFSTEGTPRDLKRPIFIDGDLLSVRDGTIFRSNSALLPNLPAGIPARGVDWGLDAYSFGRDPRSEGPLELFSTEIVGRAETPFTDGDALVTGPNVEFRNLELIRSLAPATFDLGLDALHLPYLGMDACAPAVLTFISNIDVDDIDAQGLAQDGVSVSDKPFGGWLRFQAALPLFQQCPQLANFEFRVELDNGSGFPSIGDPNTLAVPTTWQRQVDIDPTIGVNCVDQPYQPSGDGWFNLADYRRFDECGEDPSAAVWFSGSTTRNLDPAVPPAPETVRFRIVMREVGAAAYYSVGTPHRVRIDNDTYKLPDSKDMPLTGDMSMTLAAASGSDATVDDCKIEAGNSDVILELLGRARDQHFWRYTLRWAGGNAVGWRSITPTEDSVFDNDGSDRAALSLSGTQPANDPTVLLSEFNLTQAHISATGGEPPIECGYTVELTAWERTWNGSFSASTNTFSASVNRRTAYPLAFCFQPSGA